MAMAVLGSNFIAVGLNNARPHSALGKVICRYENISHAWEPDRFLNLPAEFNRQRLRIVAGMGHIVPSGLIRMIAPFGGVPADGSVSGDVATIA
jgi:hypothetical protein